jgi:hypothetical protein
MVQYWPLCTPHHLHLSSPLFSPPADSEEQITTRLRNAQEEVESVKEAGLYDYVIVNNDLEAAYTQLAAVAQRALAGEVGGPETSGGAAGAAAAAGGAAGVAAARSGSPTGPMSSSATFKNWLQPGGPQDGGGGAPVDQQQQEPQQVGALLCIVVCLGNGDVQLLADRRAYSQLLVERCLAGCFVLCRCSGNPQRCRQQQQQQWRHHMGWSGSGGAWRL